ncbi:MAG TPA: hypothetical protein ENK17_06880, partial [Anaerolineae bacterium]|nr:hypothetical protein [Anaerolineae bacterium]
GHLDDLAALDEVLWVEPYFEPQLYNDVGGGTIMRAAEIRGSLGLYGSGQTVAVADTGLDTGDQNTLHPDLAGRVSKTYCLGRPSPCDWSDYVAHGTHVAGSVLGNGSASGSTPASHQYANSYAGVAPEAHLVFQSIADSHGGLGGIPSDDGDLMRTAYDDGARIHTNSWGGPTGGTVQDPEYGGYVVASQQVDQAMWEHKDLLVLFAAGNEGDDENADGVIDPDSVGQPGTAKNVLTVGASENDRDSISTTWGDSYGEPIASDRRADDPSGMAAFSSRGPTDDGRVKPDIVAPGTYVASVRTRQYAFDDDLEGDTSRYSIAKNNGGQGTGDSWQLLTDDPHTSSHYWKDAVSGNFGGGAMTILLTPPVNVYPTGGFDISFWHKYSLGGDNQLVLWLTDGDVTPMLGLVLTLSGSQNSYTLFTVGPFSNVICDNYGQCIDPTDLRVGFTIYSESGSYNSQWWLDDIRVDGGDWGTMSSVGLAQPGDAVDEHYLMMGGTSMATPLTAGAAALVREWLTRIKGVSNPSAALMKAILINGAADMPPGQYGSGSTQEVPALRPNNVTGWGRVDLVESLNPPAPRRVWFEDNTTGLSTGSTAVYTLTVGQTSSSSSVGQAANLPYYTLYHSAAPSSARARSDSSAKSVAGYMLKRVTSTIPNPSVTFSAIRSLPTDLGSAYLLPQLPSKEVRHPVHQVRPMATTNLLQNGSFENATGTNLDYWDDNDPYGYYIGQTDTDAYDGTYSAFMGGYYGADLGLWQGVSFPSDATDAVLQVYVEGLNLSGDSLQAELWIETGDPDTLVDTYTLNAVNESWTENTWPLSADTLNQLKGQTVYVLFRATMASTSSYFLLDLASLSVTTGGTSTPTSTPTPGPTPTDTPTPTPTPGTCPEAIADGGFEQATGDTTHPNWHVADNARFTVNQSIARTGQNAAILGYTSGPPSTGDLWQTVNIPSDASSATLSFWYQTMGDGSFTVDVDITDSGGNNVLVHLTTLTTATFDWQQYDHAFTAAELAAIAGQDVRLRFHISGVGGPEDVVLDDVSWQVCTGGGTTSTPTPTPTPPSQTGGTFRITLAWTDYPGEPTAAKALVNDLDLEVIGPDGTHYYGNQGLYTAGQCLRGGKWDACNNVEGIIIAEAVYGTYTVIVHGYNVPHGPQPFAVVAAGDNLQEGSGTPPPDYDHFVYLPLVLKQ